MTDDDIRRTMLDFKASVSADLDAMHRRLDTFTDEMRDRLRQVDERVGQVDERVCTAESAVINEIRALETVA